MKAPEAPVDAPVPFRRGFRFVVDGEWRTVVRRERSRRSSAGEAKA